MTSIYAFHVQHRNTYNFNMYHFNAHYSKHLLLEKIWLPYTYDRDTDSNATRTTANLYEKFIPMQTLKNQRPQYDEWYNFEKGNWRLFQTKLKNFNEKMTEFEIAGFVLKPDFGLNMFKKYYYLSKVMTVFYLGFWSPF